MDVLLLSKKKKTSFTLGLVMVYLYKCPICAFRAMDRTKGCGSDNFIGRAFLSVSPSIGHLTETSLKMPYVHLPEREGGTAACTTTRIHTILPLFKKKVLERSHLLDQMHVFGAFRCVELSYWIIGFWVIIFSNHSTWKKDIKLFRQVFNMHTVHKFTDLHLHSASDLVDYDQLLVELLVPWGKIKV